MAHTQSPHLLTLLILSKGPLLIHLFQVIINNWSLSSAAAALYLTNQDPETIIRGPWDLIFLKVFFLNPLLCSHPQHKLWPSSWQISLTGSWLKIANSFSFFLSLPPLPPPVQLVPTCDDLFCSSHWRFCFLLFQPPAGFPTWCWVIWCRCSKRLVFMSLADGLGKLHDVPAALLRPSQLPLIHGLPVAPAHVQNFRALGEHLGGSYPKVVRLLWVPQSEPKRSLVEQRTLKSQGITA